jgi:hypothetical protein
VYYTIIGNTKGSLLQYLEPQHKEWVKLVANGQQDELNEKDAYNYYQDHESLKARNVF